MDREKQETKLKQLCKNNKKLLQSISTHLINNPDQLESKLHEHRYLEQKYNELFGFSRENVERYEKLQVTLALKQEEINRLNKMLQQVKQQAAIRVQQVEKDYRRKKNKEEQENTSYKQEINLLKRELVQMKQKYSTQKKNLQQSQHSTTQKLYQYQKQIQKYKINEQNLENRVKELQSFCNKQGQQIKRLQEDKEKLTKNRKKQEIDQMLMNIKDFRKKDKD